MTSPLRFLRACLAAVLLAAPIGVLAQSHARVSGTWTENLPDFEERGTFSCDGMPTCSGQFASTFREGGCSNYGSTGGSFAITGLDLTRSGAIQGTISARYSDYDFVRNPDGTCTYKSLPEATESWPYTGTWDLASGTGSMIWDFGGGDRLPVSFKADVSAPVFAMTVTSRIDSVSATATANIQFRPEDVGTSGSVFVFAVAPSTRVRAAADGAPPFVIGKTVRAAGTKADAVACVLAQLNASGQLQAVSASSLQAYISGVLSGQGQAVSIMNGVPTPNVAGATFFVGYGSSASAMINNGINRSAVTVPATQECRPQPPQTGWWWNPLEPGRGFSIEVQGRNLFMATYLYDASGRATWHVAAGATSIDGSVFSGQLLTFGNGVTLSGPYRANSPLAGAGPVSLTFDDASRGTLVWPGGTVAIQRFPVAGSGSATPLANQPQSGWWWGGAADNGRGFFIEWQGSQAFLAGYMYDSTGNPIWYVSQGSVTNAQSYQGTWLQFAGGQTLTGAYKPASLVNGSVAPVAIQFQGVDTGQLTLPSGTIPISRFRF